MAVAPTAWAQEAEANGEKAVAVLLIPTCPSPAMVMKVESKAVVVSGETVVRV
jgi:hypothetical protein